MKVTSVKELLGLQKNSDSEGIYVIFRYIRPATTLYWFYVRASQRQQFDTEVPNCSKF